jgi:hypothetical protein
VEASADPARGEAAADRLAALDLAAGHLAHMPAHIYNRVGRHADSIEANRAAIAADEAFLARAGDAASPLYRYGYAPHNVHFLLVAAQSAGLGEEAVAAAERLAAMTSEELAGGYAWVQAINTAPFTVHAQFSDPATILALPEPAGAFPSCEGFPALRARAGLRASGRPRRGEGREGGPPGRHRERGHVRLGSAVPPRP